MDKPEAKANGSSTSSKLPPTSTISNDVDAKSVPPPSKNKEEAIKARIIKHMNTDHAESLSLYLQHYCDLSISATENPKLTDITYESLTIQTSNASATYTIPIEPRMQSWSDARPRVVAMDRDARAALGLPPLPSDSSSTDHSSSSSSSSSSPITVTTYDPPTAPFHLFVIFLVIWFYTGYFLLRNGTLRPGTWYWEHVMCWFPVQGAEGYRWLNMVLAGPVVGVHGAEAVWMVGRLRWYGVEAGTGLWWKWVGSTFLEGGGAHQRLGAVVRRGGGGRERRGS
jgi:hypothetical protein